MQIHYLELIKQYIISYIKLTSEGLSRGNCHNHFLRHNKALSNIFFIIEESSSDLKQLNTIH